MELLVELLPIGPLARRQMVEQYIWMLAMRPSQSQAEVKAERLCRR